MTSKLHFNCEQEIMVFDDNGLTSAISSFMFNITLITDTGYFCSYYFGKRFYMPLNTALMFVWCFSTSVSFLKFFFITALSE